MVSYRGVLAGVGPRSPTTALPRLREPWLGEQCSSETAATEPLGRGHAPQCDRIAPATRCHERTPEWSGVTRSPSWSSTRNGAPRRWVLASWTPCRASSTLSVTDRGSGVAEPVAPMDANGPGSHTGVVDGGHDEPLASDLRCAACPVCLGLDVRSEATQAGVGRRHLRGCPPKAEPRGRHGLTPRRRVLTDQPEGAPLGSRCGTVDRERVPRPGIVD